MTQTIAENGTINYLRAALYNQYNVILLAGSASFSAALASWTPLVSGLVGEAVWLLAAPRLTAFRRHADAQQRSEVVARVSVPPPLPALAPEYTERATAVEAALRNVEQLCATRSDFTAADRQE